MSSRPRKLHLGEGRLLTFTKADNFVRGTETVDDGARYFEGLLANAATVAIASKVSSSASNISC